MTKDFEQHLEEATTYYLDEGYSLQVAEELARLDATAAYLGDLKATLVALLDALPTN